MLKTFSKLKTAYFIQNKISRIEGLEPLAATLTSIELGGNKLRVRSFAERPARERPAPHR